MSTFVTYWPWWLTALTALLALWGERRRFRGMARWFEPGVLAKLGRAAIPQRWTLAVGLLAVFATAMALHRLEPAPTGTRWVLIDLSRSMAVREPDGRTRWAQVQAALDGWAAQSTDPVALIGFQHDAWLLLPPTRDRDALRQTLRNLTPKLDRQSADPAAGIRLWERLRDPSEGLLVVSDGEWASEPPIPAGPVIALACGDLAGGAVPPVPGDPGPGTSVPDRHALDRLADGRSLNAATATAAAIEGAFAATQQKSREWTILALVLVLAEGAMIIGRRYRISLTRLPYAWVQRYALWQARRAGVLLLLALLPGAAAGWQDRWQGQSSAALAAYNTGVEALAAGKRAAAIAAWQQAVRLDPAWQPAWYNLGTLLAASPATRAEAQSALTRAVTLDPDDSWAVGNLQALQARPVPDGKKPQPSPVPSAMGKDGADGPPRGARRGAGADHVLKASADLPKQSGKASGGALQPSMMDERDTDALAAEIKALSAQPPGRQPAGTKRPAIDPASLPPLSAKAIDKLLDAADTLTPEQLAALRRHGGDESGALPPLTAEQLQRAMAIAARMPVSLPPVSHEPPAAKPKQPAAQSLWW